MQVPFTATQFVHVFAEYNRVVWPAVLLAYALAAAGLWGAFKRPGTASDRLVTFSLAAMWAFTGIGYHLMSFSAINPVAKLFGAGFVVQAALFAVAGLRGSLRFRFAGEAHGWIGVTLAAHAMVLYPLIGFALGHGFPNGPSFGLTPCPLTIFTFGMLLLADRAPRHLTVLPMLWALIGSTAALSLGIREDLTLLVAGLLGTSLVVLRPRATASARRMLRSQTQA